VGAGTQQTVDVIEDPAFATSETLVLALVLLPGADYEHLLKDIAVGQVTVQMPVRRPRPAPDPAQLSGTIEKSLVIARCEGVGHGDHDGPLLDRCVLQLR
jgi:hypothetical protein